VAGVRPGRCVAFVKPGSDELVLLVEPADDADPTSLGRTVRRSVADAIGVVPSEVLVLPHRTIEKTTSGKLRRSAMRSAYAEGELAGAGAGE
jgi:acyl-CoA synthetase (AMP-forming)/AMP-acid ligase II